MKVITKYVCPLCETDYETKNEATKCMNSNDTPKFKAGDIVEANYGFGWFDGDKRWVINPDVDQSKHGFDETCSIGFYYVVTLVELISHRATYHLATNAMTGKRGYKEGYTFLKGHLTLKLIKAPNFVIEDSKKLIGKKSTHLL